MSLCSDDDDNVAADDTTIVSRLFLEEKPGERARTWQQFRLETGVVHPSYEIPPSASFKCFTRALLNGADYVANVLLPFHSAPAWPLVWEDDEDPLSLMFYYCGGDACQGGPVYRPSPPSLPEATTPGRGVFQVALQFFVSKSGDDLDVNWVVRLLCSTCAPLTGNTSYCPVILEVRAAIAPRIARGMCGFTTPREHCCICDIKLRRVHRCLKGTIPICGADECARVLREHRMDRGRILNDIYHPSGYQRVLRIIHHLKDAKADVVSPVRWNVCHRADGSCMNEGHQVCATCARVVYCGDECARASRIAHAPHCVPVLDMWGIQNLRGWRDEFLSWATATPSGEKGVTTTTPDMSLTTGEPTSTRVYCKCENKHGGYERAARRVAGTRSKARNRGRVFYSCALRKDAGGCGMFRWEDSVADEYDRDSFCVSDSDSSGVNSSDRDET